jgi:hypothetical protein
LMPPPSNCSRPPPSFPPIRRSCGGGAGPVTGERGPGGDPGGDESGDDERGGTGDIPGGGSPSGGPGGKGVPIREFVTAIPSGCIDRGPPCAGGGNGRKVGVALPKGAPGAGAPRGGGGDGSRPPRSPNGGGDADLEFRGKGSCAPRGRGAASGAGSVIPPEGKGSLKVGVPSDTPGPKEAPKGTWPSSR